MASDILIIGSGFAARQLVKNIRHQDKSVPVRLIAADSCDEYNKPELSHVFSLGQRADDLTRQSAAAWAESHNVALHPHTRVESIDNAAHIVHTTAGDFGYAKLVLATGADAILPAVPGSELLYTLNSQQEYSRCEAQLANAKRILLIGGGLIGTEIAMDLNRAGKDVTVTDRSAGLLASLLPPEISARLQRRLMDNGVSFMFKTEITEVVQHHDSLIAMFSDGHRQSFDAVVCAIGLRPAVVLARDAGIIVRRGVVVNDALATSAEDVYALGDCAEIQGELMSNLQPATLAAMTLAKNLTGDAAKLTLPTMLVKVKTPDMPLHLAGDPANPALVWNMEFSPAGVIAKGCNETGELLAFVVSEDHMKMAFPMLKDIRLPATR